MDLFSTLQLLHEAVMSVLVTTIYGRWRGTITVRNRMQASNPTPNAPAAPKQTEWQKRTCLQPTSLTF